MHYLGASGGIGVVGGQGAPMQQQQQQQAYMQQQQQQQSQQMTTAQQMNYVILRIEVNSVSLHIGKRESCILGKSKY